MELASTPRCVCHMKGMEVPSVKPLGQAPMGMEGASCGEHERESCLRTGLEGTFMPFVLFESNAFSLLTPSLHFEDPGVK